MDRAELRELTKRFALRVMALVAELPASTTGRAIAAQIIRSGTSVGANYRAACRARSRAEFVAKVGIVEEEADETAYWLELIVEGALLPEPKARPLLQEAEDLTAILAATGRTAKGNS